ncbi:MAG TPA: hypothetical protein DDW68_07540 [Verrucomicrobiales bacterium]|nr:hypothetical protein [Verrucomicrobiales bacterium]
MDSYLSRLTALVNLCRFYRLAVTADRFGVTIQNRPQAFHFSWFFSDEVFCLQRIFPVVVKFDFG